MNVTDRRTTWHYINFTECHRNSACVVYKNLCLKCAESVGCRAHTIIVIKLIQNFSPKFMDRVPSFSFLRFCICIAQKENQRLYIHFSLFYFCFSYRAEKSMSQFQNGDCRSTFRLENKLLYLLSFKLSITLDRKQSISWRQI